MGVSGRCVCRVGAALVLTLGLSAPAVHAQPTSSLIAAVRAADLVLVRSLIAAGADVDARQGDGATALHWAAHRNDLDAAALLVQAGAKVDVANALQATPLWLAAVNGSAPMLELLLDVSADPNVSLVEGETPLMSAARAGNVASVELLLAAGADVDAAELERGQTALMWAVAQGHAAVARVLIDRGADLHARSRVWDQLENTAGNTNPSGNFRMVHGGSTPLLVAARWGDVSMARVLVEAGADVDDTAAAGTSALVIAAHSGHDEFGRYLLEQGADADAAGAGYTALHAAVLRGQGDLVRTLLDHGADPNAVITHGTPGRRFSADYSIRHQAVGANAFWLAAKYGELNILRMLAAAGTDPSVTPANGVSALQACMGVPAISQENRRNRVGVPMTDLAVLEGLVVELARVVLEMGVDVNIADQRGNTALHDAVRAGLSEAVAFLTRRGADVNAANDRNQTALTLAETPLPVTGTNGRRATQPEIAAFLRSLGAED